MTQRKIKRFVLLSAGGRFFPAVFGVPFFRFFYLALDFNLEVEYCLANLLKPLDPIWQYGEPENGAN